MARHVVVQISDVHLSAAGVLRSGARPRENLVALLAHLEAARVRPDLVLLTGDLADEGDPACYRDLAELLQGSAALAGAGIVVVPGNHDARPALRRHLLGVAAAGGPVDSCHWHGGLRVVALDSTVPGEEHGELAEESLAFLAAELATPAPDGTLVALHHPPIASPIAPMARLALAAPERLAAVVAGTDVRLVVCGHNHHVAAGALGGVPVWVGPAVAYRADVTSRHEFRPLPGSAYSLIEVDGAGARATVVPVVPGAAQGATKR